MVEVWKNVKHLTTERANVEFLQSIKKVTTDDVWKHIEGEVHSLTLSNGGHYLGTTRLVMEADGVQWIVGEKIRFKISDIQIPRPYEAGMEIKKARNIEILDGANWVPKSFGGVSSFFPKAWDKEKIIEETALAYLKAKKNPSTYWDAIGRKNAYEVLASDGTTKIRFFYGDPAEVNPLLNGSISPTIKSSFPNN